MFRLILTDVEEPNVLSFLCLPFHTLQFATNAFGRFSSMSTSFHQSYDIVLTRFFSLFFACLSRNQHIWYIFVPRLWFSLIDCFPLGLARICACVFRFVFRWCDENCSNAFFCWRFDEIEIKIFCFRPIHSHESALHKISLLSTGKTKWRAFAIRVPTQSKMSICC